METILITGGTGRLGNIIIDGLLKENYKVIFTSRSQKNISNTYNKYLKIQNKNRLIGFKVNQEEENYVKKLNVFLIENNIKKVRFLATCNFIKIKNDRIAKIVLFDLLMK